MTTNKSPDFSFDVYPGLDQELGEIYRRNVDEGIATPFGPDPNSFHHVVANVLRQSPDHNIDPAVSEWASSNLTTRFTLWHDRDYGLYPIGDLLNSTFTTAKVKEFVADRSELFTRLHEAKLKLTNVNEQAPNGEMVGAQMNLVLVPWAAFKQNLEDLPGWINSLRGKQGVETADFFNDTLIKAIRSEGRPIYRNPDYQTLGQDPSAEEPWISTQEYLDKKMLKDGPWGVMLAQTSDVAGLKRIVEGPADQRSPNALTNSGNDRFLAADIPVDDMGVLEWLALTLQEDPKKLSSEDLSWLLANRLTLDSGVVSVPDGRFNDGRVRSGLYYAEYDYSGLRPRYDYSGLRPRLAVM